MMPQVHVDPLCSTEYIGVRCGGALLHDSATKHVYDVLEDGAHFLLVGSLVALRGDAGKVLNAEVTAINVAFVVEDTAEGITIDATTSYKLTRAVTNGE